MTSVERQPSIWALTLRSAKEAFHSYFSPLRNIWIWHILVWWINRKLHPRLYEDIHIRYKDIRWAGMTMTGTALTGLEESLKNDPNVELLQQGVQAVHEGVQALHEELLSRQGELQALEELLAELQNRLMQLEKQLEKRRASDGERK